MVKENPYVGKAGYPKADSSRRIKYIGHKEAVYVSGSNSWPATTFKRGEPVSVGSTLAESLLRQTDKFEEAH